MIYIFRYIVNGQIYPLLLNPPTFICAFSLILPPPPNTFVNLKHYEQTLKKEPHTSMKFLCF